jgi:hypothetical protein
VKGRQVKSEIKITARNPVLRISLDLEAGIAFIGQIGAIKSVFLKHYSGIVDLANPTSTRNTNFEIVDFRQVNLEIIVDG